MPPSLIESCSSVSAPSRGARCRFCCGTSTSIRKRITIMDFDPDDAALEALDRAGHRPSSRIASRRRIWARCSGEHLSAGDLLIDLAWNIDCGEIVQWCHDHGVLYINTSVELWDPYAGAGDKHPTERTLYWRHMNLRRMIAVVDASRGRPRCSSTGPTRG